MRKSIVFLVVSLFLIALAACESPKPVQPKVEPGTVAPETDAGPRFAIDQPATPAFPPITITPTTITPTTIIPMTVTPTTVVPTTIVPRTITPTTITPTTVVPTNLMAARDLTGTWKGIGEYYYLDIASGRRVKTVTVDITMKVVQQDNKVKADMEISVVKQEPAGEVSVKDAIGNEIYVITAAGDENVSLIGTVSVTTLTLATTGTIGYTDQWQFTFTTDLMSGGFHTEQPPVPYEVKSDPKAFGLNRQP